MTVRALAMLAILPFATVVAQRPTLGAGVRAFVAIDSPSVAIRHVRVIDGTGAPPRENQTVLIRDGKIASVAPTTASVDNASTAIDGTGKTLLPGYVLVHEHMFYPAQGPVPFYDEMAFSFPRLYLAAGITTARTGGSMHPLADITLKKWIDAGRIPGPKLNVTGPYLSGANGAPLIQFRELRDSADARRTVAYFADVGATSFKAYMWITRDELRAATDEAHKRGLKITGHLCSVTFREAAEIGIDNLEHGITAATDFVVGKQPDVCPSTSSSSAIAKIDPATDTTLASVVQTLVRHKVAVTSTLAIFETFVPRRGAVMMQPRLLDAMSPAERSRYTTRRAGIDTATSTWTQAFAAEMAFEKRFADAGGLLLAGTDPTGYGGVIAGFGSQRTIELLVEAGFTPVQAIQIATQNGARYLGRESRVGTIAVGRDADLILIDGNPAADIRDIEKVLYVFKDGVAYDSAKLIAAVKGMVGVQ